MAIPSTTSTPLSINALRARKDEVSRKTGEQEAVHRTPYGGYQENRV